MADQDDVRRIALGLPGIIEETGRFAFSIATGDKLKGVVWVWLERLAERKARVPNPAVLAVRVADQNEKAALLAADPDKFFTEPHYNGYPAVLVRLDQVTEDELRKLIDDAWRCQAPRRLLTPREELVRAAQPAKRVSRSAAKKPGTAKARAKAKSTKLKKLRASRPRKRPARKTRPKQKR
ncbi:MAG: MmcQ/YjbR family DNA-binding protein [Deltaproteobacteria bacterium]|nr:MmcQ/YjbR family DNA-binding protein [Deltaproteobacteria bacterium]MCW5807846.1 MmcQ/YjbR family DNA-binding protein [Deltaproteobacteria bacterium]